MNKLLIHTFGKIKLDKNGIWYHDDAPFINEKMARLFHKSIIKLPDNTYALKIEGSQVAIDVEDVVSWVTDVDVSSEKSEIKLYFSNDTSRLLTVQDRLITNKDNELFVIFKDGTKSKFFRNSYNILTRYLGEKNDSFFIEAGKLIIPIDKF
jgi:hypothetical protein